MMNALVGERALGAATACGRNLLEGEGLRLRRDDHARLVSVGTTAKPLARKLEVCARMENTVGNHFGATLYGEFLGGGVSCIINGCPPKLPLTEVDIQFELDRRRPGQSGITTPLKETDTCKILSGVTDGLTLGTPIGVVVPNTYQRPNTDQRGGDYSEVSLAYADATYGIRAFRGGGRSSARETIRPVVGCVAAGAVAKKFLKQYTGTTVLAYVSRVHGVELPEGIIDHNKLTMEQQHCRCPDPETATKMIAAIDALRVRGDSAGGEVTCIVQNVPKGLGSPIFDQLDSELVKAVMSVPAASGFGFPECRGACMAPGSFMTASEVNRDFYIDDSKKLCARRNRSRGIQDGISTGEMIVMTISFYPTSTQSSRQRTITWAHGHHDPCVVPQGVPIVESRVALVLADQLLQHYAQ